VKTGMEWQCTFSDEQTIGTHPDGDIEFLGSGTLELRKDHTCTFTRRNWETYTPTPGGYSSINLDEKDVFSGAFGASKDGKSLAFHFTSKKEDKQDFKDTSTIDRHEEATLKFLPDARLEISIPKLTSYNMKGAVPSWLKTDFPTISWPN